MTDEFPDGWLEVFMPVPEPNMWSVLTGLLLPSFREGYVPTYPSLKIKEHRFGQEYGLGALMALDLYSVAWRHYLPGVAVGEHATL